MASATSSAPANDRTRPVAAMRFKRYPSVRAILLIVNLTVLILPLGGFVFFRIYENRLVHEAEAELIVQAAFLGEAMKLQVMAAMPDFQNYGTPLDLPKPQDEYYTPVAPQLDLSKNEILPRRPDGIPTPQAPGAALLNIGRQLTGLFTGTQKTTLAGMRLLDHRGGVIGGRDEVGLSLAHIPEVREAMGGRYVSVIRVRISDDPPPPLASISRGDGHPRVHRISRDPRAAALGLGLPVAHTQQHHAHPLRRARQIHPRGRHGPGADAHSRPFDVADDFAAGRGAHLACEADGGRRRPSA